MEKRIDSLEDLIEAAQDADREGACIIRLPNGQLFELFPAVGTSHYDDVEDDGLIEALERGLAQLNRGEGVTTNELLMRLRTCRKMGD